jgi:GNAT superfamily N-acetyltransferase
VTLGTRSILVRRAAPVEIDDVTSILSEAAEWLMERGIEQWPNPFPIELVVPSLEQGRTFLALSDGVVAGTITLLDSYSYWPDSPPDALYVRRVAIRRPFVGLGRFLMYWAERQALRRNKDYLRLDCYSGNESLRRYYESLGFEFCGEIEVAMSGGLPYKCALYEKRVSAAL